jgi:hypothetical protein
MSNLYINAMYYGRTYYNGTLRGLALGLGAIHLHECN